jgi:tetratricopeptide (TPR) repeat protein
MANYVQKNAARQSPTGVSAHPVYPSFFGLAWDCPPDYPAGVIGWLGDFLRFWWGLLYWNSRKSLFRLHRDRARCPCQNLSDSGRARETGCDAAHYWYKPARFRRVCPLLVETPEGLRCSVDTRDVRPFWRRAAAYYVAAALALYLAATLGFFVCLRLIGYPLSPVTLLWPPRWPELRLARSDYFVAKAQRALDAHRVNEAILSLEIAFQNNPRNFDVGLQLAQLMSLGQPEVADRIFGLLMREHPEHRATTAEAWYKFLIVNGRFDRAASLASRLLLEDPAQRPAWLHALFFVTHHIRDDKPLRELIDKHAGELEPIYVALVNSELLIRGGGGLKLLPGLTSDLPAGAGFYGPYFQVTRLIVLGRPNEALAMLNRYTTAQRFPDADAFQLRLDVLAALGRQDLLRQRLEQDPVNARELELLSIHLVRHPNAAVLGALAQCVKRSNLPAGASTYAAYSAFFVACGVAEDWDKMRAAAAVLKGISGSRMTRLDTVEAFFQQNDPSRRLETILPTLPALSLEMIYALFDHYSGPTPIISVKLAPPP